MKAHDTPTPVRAFDRAYFNGQFVTPHGTQVVDLVNPTDNTVIGTVAMADDIDARMAISAAKEACNTFSASMPRSVGENRASRRERRSEAEIEFAGDEIGDPDKGPVESVSTGLKFRSLQEAIEAFHDCIGESRRVPAQDALRTIIDGFGRLNQRLQG
jgi:hypothetical protein